MKLLLASTAAYQDNYTGANKINRLIMELLAARGHQCYVFGLTKPLTALTGDNRSSPTEVDNLSQQVTQLNKVEVHTVNVSHLGQLPALRSALEEQIRSIAPDWIMVSSEDWGQFLLEAAIKFAPGRVVYLAHTPIALPFGPDSIMPSLSGKKLMQQTTAIVALSRFLADYIEHWGDVKACTIYPPAYGEGPFPFHDVGDEGYVTLVNPCAVKGISILLELARKLPDVSFAGVLTWGTTGADKQAMEALPNITLLPPSPDIDTIFSQTKVLLAPSLWNEAFGLIVVEAMLRGIPVLASDIGGLPEAKLGTRFVLPVNSITQYELTEELTLTRDVPEQDIKPWLVALKTLLDDPELYKEESLASCKASLDFVESLGIEQYEQLFTDLATQTELTESRNEGDTENREKRLERLSDGRRALLKLLQEEKLRAKQLEEKIPRYERPEGKGPLSLAQQRLWVIEQLTPDSALYTIPFVARLHGELDLAALQATLNDLAARHEALRTTIVASEGEAQQQIAASQAVALPLIDLSALPGATRQMAATAVVDAAVQKPFDLQRGPLFRALLVRETAGCQRLVVTVHHIVCDGWSWGIFVREFAALYQQHAGGTPAALPELPIQYADFAAWQRERLQGAALKKQLDYWREQLQDVPTLLDLPTDFPRPAFPSLAGATLMTQIPASLVRSLRRFSQGRGVSLFMTMLAGFAALLSRYSRQEQIVLGTPVAGRLRAELEDVFGFFVNTLALYLRGLDQQSGEALVQQVREVVLEAFAHQEVPFDQVVELVAPERSLSHTPLVQVTFTLQTETLQEHNRDELLLQPEEVSTATAKFDLAVSAVEELDGSISLSAEYRTDLFRAETVRLLLGQYEVLLAALLAQPQIPVKRLPLLTAGQRQQVLESWNDTQSPYPQVSVVPLVAEQAQERPEAVALVDGRETVTYADLVQRANQLAHLLAARGVRRGDRVGVYLHRSARLVEVLLGIVTAGAAYVPLDVSYPASRLSFMVKDAQPALIVTESSLAEQLPAAVPLLDLDAVAQVCAAYPTTPPPVTVGPDDLAYVIYTSGSTGRPKGVAIPHRGIVRLVRNTNYLTITPDDCLSQSSTVSFDAATFEIWGALLNGARLLTVHNQTILDPGVIRNLLIRERTTIVFLTTALFRHIAYTAPKVFNSLRCVITGGEAADPGSMRRAIAFNPVTQFIHAYGPTETTTYATTYDLALLPEDAITAPIGKAIANDRVYVLDEALQPVPPGVPGELYIGGDGVAWGYLNRPALTAERFIPDSFGRRPGARLYRTGDLVRWLPQGNLEFLGRIDQQVKLRGFRIEPGEIEAVLLRQPGLRDAAVLVREDRPDERRLVAYFTTVDGHGPTVGVLHEALQRELPAYMVPGVLVPLDVLPLSPNGKLDREKLPAPPAPDETAEEKDESMTATEQKLAEIWKKVLGLQHISRDDNFFSLGGDSLLAIQAVNQANHGGLQLTTRMLFQYQTIAELAEQEPQKNTVIAIQKPVSGKVSLLPIVSWFDTLRLARPDYFNQTLLLESSEPLNPDVLQETLNALVVHHDALRLRFRSRPTGPPELFIDSTLSAPLIQVIDLEDESDLGACIQQIEASLSIENGPILRLAVLRQKEGHDLLLFVCHHLAVDGLSWRILLEDLETGYRQSQHGKPIKLPPKTSDLISWGKALDTYLDSDDFSQEVKIWQRYADLTVPPLPSDEQGGVNTVASTESISITLSAEETTALLTQVPVAFRCRTDELLLAAVCSTLRSWIDSEIIALALESHGRASLPGVDVSRTVGWFTSLYPAVLSISADSIPASVAAVRDQLRELPQLGLSFSLGRYLGSEPTQQMLATLPVPQISFNYMGQFGRGRDAKSRNLFRPAAKDAGIGQAPENVRPFSIDIISSVQGDRLEIHWIFSKNLHRRETINELAETFVEVCRRLIAGGWEWSETKPPMPHRPSLLVPINRHGTHPPFFCVHPSGGTSFCYRKLSHHLGADQPFYGFQAPGLEIGEQPFSDLKQMAARYVEEMRLVQPIGPYYIGGWSFGGVIAAEMAQQLRVAEQPVALLAIIDVDPFLSSYQQTQARRMIKLSERIATANDLDPSQIKKLRLGEQVDYLFDGSEQEDRMLDHERFLTLLRVFSAHARARLAYTPALYDGRVAIFRARNQAILEQSQVSPIRLLLRQLTGWLRNGQNNPTMGWDSFCHGVIEQYDIPGHHLSIMNEPFVLILAEQLAEALRHARAAY